MLHKVLRCTGVMVSVQSPSYWEDSRIDGNSFQDALLHCPPFFREWKRTSRSAQAFLFQPKQFKMLRSPAFSKAKQLLLSFHNYSWMTPHPRFPSPRTLSALHLFILKTLPSPHFPPEDLAYPHRFRTSTSETCFIASQTFPPKIISILANLSSKGTCTQRARIMPGSQDLGTCHHRNMINVGGRNECELNGTTCVVMKI